MAQAFFPHGSPLFNETENPNGDVLLNSKSGDGVNYRAIFNKAAQSLGLDKAAYLDGDSLHHDSDQWLAKIKEWLPFGPVILGIGPPSSSGHFTVVHGYVGGSLQIVDPGGVFWQFWKSNCEFSVRMPPADQWDPPVNKSNGEYDYRDYLSVKKEHVAELLKKSVNLTSFTAPGGPVLGGVTVTSGTTSAPAATPAPAPAEEPDSCAHCRGLQVAIDHDQVESRIRRKSHYKDVVMHFQWHLRQFGYDLGKSGPDKDGVDGDYGNATATAKGRFCEEAGIDKGDADVCSAEQASAVMAKHKEGFKTSGEPAAPPQAQDQPAEESQPAVETGEIEEADWRPYIGKDKLPDNVLAAVKKNRARYPMKELPTVEGGAPKYDYKPPADHAQWAKAYYKKKLDGASLDKKHLLVAYLEMLDKEGLPASFNTYDNQIVTWGVGLGGLGNGKETFEQLNKNPDMTKLLDGLGINYFDYYYQVVDLTQKKVVSSDKKMVKDKHGKMVEDKGDDKRHTIALDSWRRQPDLLSAIIGISEDKATRETVAEAQFAVYLGGAAAWPGQDKVFTQALFFMIVHMHAWYPAFAKYGFKVDDEFTEMGGGTPSLDTDKMLAPRLARAFVRYGKDYFAKRKQPKSYDDLRTRTKTHLWATMKKDGKKEGFDPGELTYDFD